MSYQIDNQQARMVLVALLNVVIRRDANTITPTTVPEYELGILSAIHSKENIQPPADGIIVAGEREVDADGEFERMIGKYGPEMAVKVFGEDGSRLREMVFVAAEKYADHKAKEAASVSATAKPQAVKEAPAKAETKKQRDAREAEERRQADEVAAKLADPESDEAIAAAAAAAALAEQEGNQ